MAVLLPFLLLLFALSLVFQVDVFFTAVWFLLLLYVLSRLWARRAGKFIRLERQFVDRGFTGDSIDVTLTLSNESRLPIPWLEIDESIPNELRAAPFPAQAISLGGKKSRDFTYRLFCRRRGYYTLGPLRVETGDVLGLEDDFFIVRESRPLLVYPRVVPLQRLNLPTRSALVTLPARTPLFEDPSRVMGVRDYQQGDSPRRIHWSATARLQRMVVKQYQPAVTRETLLCLNLDVKDYPQLRYDATEQAIVVAASLAAHMVNREGLPAGLATEGRESTVEGRHRMVIPPGAQRGQLMAILEVLARVQVQGNGDFPGMLRELSVHLPWGSTLIAITGVLDDDLAATLLYLKRSGYAVALILVQPPSGLGSAGEMGNLAGVPIHRVWMDSDLAVLE